MCMVVAAAALSALAIISFIALCIAIDAQARAGRDLSDEEDWLL